MCSGGVAEQVETPVMLGFETAPLGVGEARGRQREGGEVEQCLLQAGEALLEACREGAEGRKALGLWPDGGEGVADEGGALTLGVGRAPGGGEGHRLALLEAMAECRVQQSLLVLVGQGTEGVGERGTDASFVESVLGGGSESGGKGVAASDPGLAASEQASGRGEGEAVVADERVDDARLVHRREGARWSVGAQHQRLALEGGQRVLDDHGDVSRARGGPASQPLETIDDLEGAVLLRDDSQRQVLQWLRGLRPRFARTKVSEACAQPLDGQVDDEAVRGRQQRRRSRYGEGGCHHSGR